MVVDTKGVLLLHVYTLNSSSPSTQAEKSDGWVRIFTVLSLSVLCILLCMIYAHWKPYKEIHFQFEPNLVSIQFYAIPIQWNGPSDKRTHTPLKLYSRACALPVHSANLYTAKPHARALQGSSTCFISVSCTLAKDKEEVYMARQLN